MSRNFDEKSLKDLKLTLIHDTYYIWILYPFSYENIYLYTWRVIVDHIENVDKTEKDCNEETHTAGNNLGSEDFCQHLLKVANLRWNNEWCPWDNNEEAWR